MTTLFLKISSELYKSKKINMLLSLYSDGQVLSME